MGARLEEDVLETLLTETVEILEIVEEAVLPVVGPWDVVGGVTLTTMMSDSASSAAAGAASR